MCHTLICNHSQKWYQISPCIIHILMVKLISPHLNFLPLASSTSVTTYGTNREAGNFSSPAWKHVHMSNGESSENKWNLVKDHGSFHLITRLLEHVNLTSKENVQSCCKADVLQILKNCNYLEVKKHLKNHWKLRFLTPCRHMPKPTPV